MRTPRRFGNLPGYSRAVATRAHLPWLAGLLAAAAWSAVPPYLGPPLGLELDVSSSVEVVDHVLPGAIAAVAAGLALHLARRGETDSTRALMAVGACALSGLWNAASHTPLLLDAGSDERPWDAVLFHSVPGLALTALALVLLLRPAA